MKNFPFPLRCLMAAFLMGGALNAYSYSASDIQVYRPALEGNAFCNGVSPNGRYVIYSSYRPDNSLFDYYGYRLDTETGELTELKGTGNPTSYGALCVSDTGTVVGVYGTGVPEGGAAYWTEEKGWTLLPCPEGEWEGGMAYSISKNGKYVAGKVYRAAMMVEKAVLWDVSGEPVILDTSASPFLNLEGRDEQQTRFTDVSDDGRWVIGQVSVSYEGGWQFLYDRETGESRTPGARYEDGRLHPIFTDRTLYGMKFSTDGQTIFGNYHTNDGETGVYTLNPATEEYNYYPCEELPERMLNARDGNGNFYASTPWGMPVREWSVMSGGYWVSFDSILRQIYGTDVARLTGYDDTVTGTLMGIDATGTLAGSLIYYPTGETYLFRMPEPVAVSAAKVDLLADYTVTPASGASLSSLRSVDMQFDRSLELCGATSTSPYIIDEEGNKLAQCIQIDCGTVKENTISFHFRKTSFEGGKQYYVVVPEGTFQIKGDADKRNREIKIPYNGRDKIPVTVTECYPAEGTVVTRFNASTDPLILTFDTEITPGQNPEGHFYLMEDGNEILQSDLAYAVYGKQVYVFPVIDQYLYEGLSYKISIAAGTFADAGGENGNEAIVINYAGGYKREISSDEVYLYKTNFNDTSWASELMFYEGDHLEPIDMMKSWGFANADQYPWWFVRDDENSYDWALASHSMYSPAGRSDDWVVLPGLDIPDDRCTLRFKSQSYMSSREDRLDVVVWENDQPVNVLTEKVMESIKDEGKLVYNELQDNGGSQETLAEEWRDNEISLADYAGKRIYIAFANRNYDGSAIFLDDVEVRHNVDFSILLTTPSTVVQKESAIISGILKVENSLETFEGLTLRLYDADGEKLDEITDGDVCLSGGDTYEFTFPRSLSLQAGESVTYLVEVLSGEARETCEGKIDNLLFATPKMIVMEEGTGIGCSACPAGHVMTEKLAEVYGERFIPIAYHTYTGDILESGLSSYTGYLGITAYPSAIFNRNGKISFPVKTGSSGALVFSDSEEPLWWDYAAMEASDGYSRVALRSEGAWLDDDMLHIPVDVEYAIGKSSNMDKVLCVVMEDNVSAYQANGYYMTVDELIGEWGKDGIYGSSMVYPYIHDNVARGLIGDGYNGTGGLLPMDVEGGETYRVEIASPLPATISSVSNGVKVAVLLIDGKSEKIEGAVLLPVRDLSGIEKPVTAALQLRKTGNGMWQVISEGEISLEVMDVSGRIENHLLGKDLLEIQVSPGIHLIRVRTDAVTRTFKIM